MGDRINLDSYAESAIEEAAYDMTTLDLDTLRDNAMERAHDNADNACIYTYHCLQILDDYESEKCVPNESEFGTKEYSSDQWREAMQAWAYEVARAVIEDRIGNMLTEIEEAADNLRDAIPEGADVDTDEIKVTRDCPHGWAAHDREDEHGAHYWVSRQLDGCNSIAIKAGPLWLSYTWTPGAAE